MIRVSFHKFKAHAGYPDTPPFDPPQRFPELEHLPGPPVPTDSGNQVYAAVRSVLCSLQLDLRHQGTDAWNPFRSLAKEGQTVLIKPNLVTHRYPQGADGIFQTISHPSIIRALIDYALIAVGPDGRVIVGDTPIENCDFGVLCQVSGLQEMMDQLRRRGHANLELLDFRTFQTIQYPDSKVVKIDLPGDPRGYTDVDLGTYSLFQELEDRCGAQNYYTLGDHTVDHLDPKTRKPGLPNNYHTSGRHVYRIPNTVLQSDCVVSLAKLKTHKFSGITMCLKNAIGICQGKEYLPHRRPGTPEEGGDSFASYPTIRYVGMLRLKRAVYSAIGSRNSIRFVNFVRRFIKRKQAHDAYSEPLFGDWHGNDTIWRATLDLNLVLRLADRSGFHPQGAKRSYLGFIDGIIGMDHEAPMDGLPVRGDLLLAGLDPIAVDTLGTYFMGFDPRKITTISRAVLAPSDVLGGLSLEVGQVRGNTDLAAAKCAFVPTKGWREYLLQTSPDYFTAPLGHGETRSDDFTARAETTISGRMREG